MKYVRKEDFGDKLKLEMRYLLLAFRTPQKRPYVCMQRLYSSIFQGSIILLYLPRSFSVHKRFKSLLSVNVIKTARNPKIIRINNIKPLLLVISRIFRLISVYHASQSIITHLLRACAYYSHEPSYARSSLLSLGSRAMFLGLDLHTPYVNHRCQGRRLTSVSY